MPEGFVLVWWPYISPFSFQGASELGTSLSSHPMALGLGLERRRGPHGARLGNRRVLFLLLLVLSRAEAISHSVHGTRGPEEPECSRGLVLGQHLPRGDPHESRKRHGGLKSPCVFY